MNSNLSCAIGFVIGAAIGSIATWQLTKKFYEQISREEIDSVKEVYARKAEQLEKVSQEKEDVKEVSAEPIESYEENLLKYSQISRKEGYINYSNSSDIPLSKQIVDAEDEILYEEDSKPYVIPPEDFGDEDGYECIALTYYSDNTLADDNDERIVDIENIVGFEALESFGEYEDDVVHVVNDRLKTYFEISRDERSYDEVLTQKPYIMED